MRKNSALEKNFQALPLLHFALQLVTSCFHPVKNKNTDSVKHCYVRPVAHKAV